MKKKIPYIIGIIIVVGIALVLANREKPHAFYDNNVNTATYTDLGILQEGAVIEQTFLCEEDMIDAIDLKVGVTGDYANCNLKMRIIDPETDEVLTECTEKGDTFKARKNHRFNITPIENCKGKTLKAELTEENSDLFNGLNIYFQSGDYYQDGKLTIDGQSYGGSLVMKTLTKTFDVETFIVAILALLFIWGFMWLLNKLFK